jgi:DNA-binding Xre family transcriptional regulator
MGLPSRYASFARILSTYGIRRVELAARAGVDMKTIQRLCSGRATGMRIGTLCRIAVALGVRPIDLVPELAAQPRRGLARRL